MKKLLQEPLVHFMLIGLVIFAFYSGVKKDIPEDSRIVIDEGQLNHLLTLWEAQWKRAPSETEMEGLVQQYIRKEVFYREALRMNLNHDDEVVKRRLAQKMEFLSDDFSTLIKPATEENLKVFYEEHQEDYRRGARYSFHQIAFTKHDSEAVQALLSEYASASPEALKGKGDMLSLPFTFDHLYAAQIKSQLGGTLASQLQELPLNQWAGPVQSGYGLHLVYITEKEDSYVPKFEAIQADLLRDYEYRASQESQQLVYDNLKANYEVVLEADLNENLRKRLMANLEQP